MKSNSFHTKLAGVSKKNSDGSSRQKIIEECVWKGHPLDLIPEPDNPYDKNAVGVWWSKDRQIGYLSAQVAETVSPLISQGIPVSAVVTDVTGGDGDNRTRGVNVLISIGDEINTAETTAQKKKTSKPFPVALVVFLIFVVAIGCFLLSKG